MIDLKQALLGLGMFGAGSVTTLLVQEVSGPPSPSAAAVSTEAAGAPAAGPGSHESSPRQRQNPFSAKSAPRGSAGVERGTPTGAPPLLSFAPPAGADTLPAADEPWADEEPLPRKSEAKQQRKAEKQQRKAYREKWKELPKEQRKALKQECKNQGYDRKQLECLQMVEYASSYGYAPSTGKKGKRDEDEDDDED